MKPQFSYELTNKRHREPINKMESLLNDYFKKRNYGDRLTEIYWGAICVSEGFEQFFMARHPKFSRKHPDVQIEYKLDFKSYTSMNDNDRFIYVWESFLKSINDCFENKQIKGFDQESFLADLNSFWSNISDYP